MVKSNRADAKHEAAHAVVAVRLGLPLAYATIRPWPLTPSLNNARLGLPSDSETWLGGHYALVEGAVESWEKDLQSSDPAARDAARKEFIQYAAVISAGIGATVESKRRPSWLDIAHQGDIHDFMLVAGLLGVGRKFKTPAVQSFLNSSLIRAQIDLQKMDAGKAWDRVTTALFRKKHLTGDEIKKIITESDAEGR